MEEEIPLLGVAKHKKSCFNCLRMGVVKYTCFISGPKIDKETQVERVNQAKPKKVKIANKFSDKQHKYCQTELTYSNNKLDDKDVTVSVKKCNKETQIDYLFQDQNTQSKLSFDPNQRFNFSFANKK